ncbi:MAG: LysM peptidoglycan-binding domain-containing protein [Bacteroidales bacterium]|nr:LysM peptidoglycan-binding domain-containing protein [Bacteroidales bacterium]
MKHTGYFLFAIFLLFSSVGVMAQFEPAPVTRSEVIETIDGKSYYIHTITQGQTLFSIAGVYEVRQQEIADANPEIPDLLQVVRTGQKIRIPRSASHPATQPPQVQTPEPRAVEPESRQHAGPQPPQIMRTPIVVTEFVEHEVARRETLFGISRKYNISQEEILHYNPEARSGLRFRQVLQIPQKTSRPVEFFYYTVQPGETKFGLAARFGISQEELAELNPEVEEVGLKAGQHIRIPARVAQGMGAIPPHQDGFVFIPDTLPVRPSVADAYCLDPVLKSHYNVALMIPLFLDQFSGYSPSMPEDHISFTFIQYYQGVLIALDSIKQQGVNITLHPFDVGHDFATVREITRQPGFDRMDLIIGPFYPETLSFVAGFGMRHGIPVVSPLLDDPSQLKGFPNLFQVSPSMETQLNALAGYLARAYPEQNIILVHNNQPQARQLIEGFKTSIGEEFRYMKQFGDSLNLARVDGYYFNGALVGGRRTNVLVASDSLLHSRTLTPKPQSEIPMHEIKEIIYSTSGLSGLVQAFDRERKNIVVTLIGGEAFLSNYLRELNQLSEEFDLALFGTPQWSDYQTIDPRYFENLNVHIFSPDFVEYRDPHIRNFVYRYREVFSTEPTIDAFRGVQTGYFFFDALGRFGREFPRCIDQLNGFGFKSPFVFEKLLTKDDGWENLKFILYRHHDYRRENVMRPFPKN